MAIAGYFARRFIRQRDKRAEDLEMKAIAYRVRHENVVRIQGYKIDSIIAGMGNVNHGAGEEFRVAFEREYSRLNSEYELTEP